MKFKSILWSILFLFLFVNANHSISQDIKKLDLNNMNDPELFGALRLPRVYWMNDNTAIIYDVRKPSAERVFERLDPVTGNRTVLFDKNKAAENFKNQIPEIKVQFSNLFPSGISETGKYMFYLINGDIIFFDITTLAFQKITNTPEEEKCVSFSPDGLKISFVREVNLYVYDITKKKEIQLTNDGSKTLLNGTLSWVYWEEIFGRQDVGYWWSPDSKSIAYLQSDESEVSTEYYVNLEPWTPTIKTQRYPKVGEKNPFVRVGIIELENPKTNWVELDKNNYEYIVRVQWFPDSKSLCVRSMNRLQTEMDYYFVDRSTGIPKHILKDKDEGWLNTSDDLYFLTEEPQFIISSEQDGYEHLYRYSLDGNLINQITKGEWSIRASSPVFWLRKAVAGIDEKDEWIYFTANEKSSIEKHLYKIKFNGKKFERLTKEEGTHIINMSPNGKYYFDQFSNINTPPSLTLYDTKGRKKIVLAESDFAGFKKYDIQYPELIKVNTRDGFVLPVSITKPKNLEQGKKYPVIVNVYGGPSAPQVANSFQYRTIWENVLLSNGYICMKIDNRAALAVSKKLENLLLYKAIGEVELDDLVDVVRYMKLQPYIDSTRFGIWGWSGGGSNTLMAMTRSKEFKAGIAGAGVTDFRFYDTKWGEAQMKTEKENLKGYEKYSLLKDAKNLSGKLMIIHGTHDDNVHIQNTWRFIDELIKSNKLFELMVYPLRGHGVGDYTGRLHLNNLMLDFWKRNL